MTVALAHPDEMAAIDREWVRRRGLAEFVRRAWPLVEPSARLVWSWHMDAICEALEAVTRRETRDLVINVPPGCSKSLITSVLWPAWQWTLEPGHRFIAACYSDRIAVRDAEKMRGLVKSAWYRARWPDVQIPEGKAASDSVLTFRTTAGGFRYSTTVRGQLTGEHCDTFIVDDPIDPLSADATSGAVLDEVLRWWTGTVPTRFRDHTRSARVCIMQRLHERDLAGEMIRAGATVLCLPMRFDPDHEHRSPRDERTEKGELLLPERVPAAELDKIEAVMGPQRTSAQMQQAPVKPGGNIFKKEYLRHRWTELPPGGTYTLSVDCKFTDAATRSWVVIQAWYALGPNHYLVDQARGHWGFVDTCRELVAMAARYPKALRKLVEKKANGAAVVNMLKATLPGFEEIEPDGGKEARANACEPLFAAGNVFVPDPTHARYADGRRGAAWLEREPDGYVREMITFPKGLADDQVDATTQYLNRCARNPTAKMEAALNRIFSPQ